jgi:hypothetical protein
VIIPASSSSEFNFSSKKLNDYLAKHEFIFCPQKINSHTYLNTAKLEVRQISDDNNVDSKRISYVVEPFLEAKMIQLDYTNYFSDNLSQNEIGTADEDSNQIKTRQSAYNAQLKRLEIKKANSLKTNERCRPGYLLEYKKKFKENRASLISLKLTKEIVENSSQLLNGDFFQIKFKFKDFFAQDDFCFRTKDGGWLISDEQLNVGVNEIFNQKKVVF